MGIEEGMALAPLYYNSTLRSSSGGGEYWNVGPKEKNNAHIFAVTA
jgi:hypothetical protein